MSEKLLSSDLSADEFERLYRENQELKSFAYLLSHDLKAPLRHVKMYTESLKENLNEKLKIEDPDTIYICSVIEASVVKMDEMINNLAELWGIKQSSSYYDLVDLNVICAKVVATILETVTDDNKIHNIKWSNLPTIECDEAQIFQLLMNLCSNAIKYQKPGNHPEVTITVSEQTNDWLISVEDNGIGIPEDKKSVVFNPFVKLNQTSLFPGSGLGLSICKKIVENHNGNIWVQAQRKLGTKISFTFSKNLY